MTGTSLSPAAPGSLLSGWKHYLYNSSDEYDDDPEEENPEKTPDIH